MLRTVTNISLLDFADINPSSSIQLTPLAFSLTFAVTWFSSTKTAKNTVSTRTNDFIFKSYRGRSMSVVSTKITVSATTPQPNIYYNLSHLDQQEKNSVDFRTGDLGIVDNCHARDKQKRSFILSGQFRTGDDVMQR